jgi:hypothetical protein
MPPVVGTLRPFSHVTVVNPAHLCCGRLELFRKTQLVILHDFATMQFALSVFDLLPRGSDYANSFGSLIEFESLDGL